MDKNNKQLGYSSIIFYSFSISSFLLSMANVFWPIGNFKMTVLSLVAMLFSVQQLLEAKEEVDIQISNLEKKSAHQEDLIHLIDPTFSTHAPTKEAQKTTVMKSRKIFALGLIIMIVGLTLDFDYQHEAIANTLTILSFAVIFFTMAYKERYATRLDQLNEQLYSIDQKLIAKLKEQVDTLQKL